MTDKDTLRQIADSYNALAQLRKEQHQTMATLIGLLIDVAEGMYEHTPHTTTFSWATLRKKRQRKADIIRASKEMLEMLKREM